MPVRFKAAENGEYTISVNPEGVEMEYLHLIDNLTGNDIDLLQTPYYTFEGRTTDYANRFKLVFRAGEGAGEAASESFAYISDGELIINTGDSCNAGDAFNASLQVFDVLGHQLFSKELSTFHSPLSVFHLPSGVYVFRLINGNEVKTQKLVIE